MDSLAANLSQKLDLMERDPLKSGKQSITLLLMKLATKKKKQTPIHQQGRSRVC